MSLKIFLDTRGACSTFTGMTCNGRAAGANQVEEDCEVLDPEEILVMRCRVTCRSVSGMAERIYFN